MNEVRGLFKVSVNSLLLAMLGGFVVLPALSMGLFSVETQSPSVLSSESIRTLSPVDTKVLQPRIEIPVTPETTQSSQTEVESFSNSQNLSEY